jgi:hypothetical protein
MSFVHVAGQNTNALQKTKCKNVANSQSYIPLNFGHLESDKKLVFYKICLIKKQALTKKTEQIKVQNSLSYGKKTSFSAILKFAAILKICEKNFQIFSKLNLILILIEKVAKNWKILKYAFLGNVVFLHRFFLHIFGKWPPQKIKTASNLIILQKSIKRNIILQFSQYLVPLRKLICKIFSNFKNQFFKNT